MVLLLDGLSVRILLVDQLYLITNVLQVVGLSVPVEFYWVWLGFRNNCQVVLYLIHYFSLQSIFIVMVVGPIGPTRQGIIRKRLETLLDLGLGTPISETAPALFLLIQVHIALLPPVDPPRGAGSKVLFEQSVLQQGVLLGTVDALDAAETLPGEGVGGEGGGVEEVDVVEQEVGVAYQLVLLLFLSPQLV